MTTYFVSNNDEYSDNLARVEAASAEDAAREFIADMYMEDEYGEVVIVWEPKVTNFKYEIATPELTLTKV